LKLLKKNTDSSSCGLSCDILMGLKAFKRQTTAPNLADDALLQDSIETLSLSTGVLE